MADNKCLCGSSGGGQRETVCIDTHRILDSCRDRDCYKDYKCLLTDYGQEIIERTTNVRAKDAEIVQACVCVEPIDFNRGFYKVQVRYYIKVTCEACLGRGSAQEFCGIVTVNKSVVLFGSEGNVHIYRSVCENCCCCEDPDQAANHGTNMPEAVVEAVDPVVLGCRVCEPRPVCNCCCRSAELPESVSCCVNGALDDREDRRVLLVSLGMFSVIRIERPAQLVVSAGNYAVPDKECRAAESETDPCGLFREMEFPIAEFSPPTQRQLER
ncbi:MAG: hypothetical protein II192_06160 [Clostridia bacterium]|nr:hypothetical protein [Clostridia bacterium]MBQ4296833.1 hypothetical protein [Clostridia bacterium]